MMKYALIILSVLAAALPASACLFSWTGQDTDIHDPHKKAIILFEDGREDLILQIAFEGPPEEFTWLLPLPARPEISEEDGEIFETFSRKTQEPWRGLSKTGLMRFATLGISGEVHSEESRVGIFDIKIVAADGGEVLADWLRFQGFSVPEDAQALLQEYIDRGWVFAAMKIAPEAINNSTSMDLAIGTIQPLRFSFPADRAVYPLKASAFGSEPSEILIYTLSPRPLIPASGSTVNWDTRFYGRLPIKHPLAENFAEGFEKIAAGEGLLSKSRGILYPDKCEDLYFDVYDPRPDLAADSLQIRMEAWSLMGLDRSARHFAVLMDSLRVGLRRGELSATMLWSLGQYRDDRARPLLIDYADRGDLACRIEAIEALAIMDNAQALQALVDGLHQRSDPESRESYSEAILQRTCCDHLLEQGDASCIPALREYMAEIDGWNVWRMDYRTPHRKNARRVLLAQLACGDQDAFSKCVEAIIDQGEYFADPERLASMRQGGRINNWPLAHITGAGICETWVALGAWDTLTMIIKDLKPRPELQDSIYRAVAADPRTRDAALTILLGNMNEAQGKHFARLESIAIRALENPHATNLLVKDSRPYLHPSILKFDLAASGAIYALARLDQPDVIRRLYDRMGGPSNDLRGEFAGAIAKFSKADDPAWQRAAETILLPYVREVWNRRAASSELDELLEVSMLRNGRPRITVPRLDPDYRSRSILNFFHQNPELRDALLEEIFASPEYHENFRLIIIANAKLLSYKSKHMQLLAKDELNFQREHCEQDNRLAVIDSSLERIERNLARIEDGTFLKILQ
jgi:hypothetical protein